MAFILRYFKLQERQSTLMQEFRAGTVTFITIAYTIAVAPAILTDSGGPCTAADCTTYAGDPACMFIVNPMPDAGYSECKMEFKKSLITACTLLSGLCSILMGLVGNVPLAMVVGMGLAPYFTYNIVGFNGSLDVNYSTAVTAVLFTGAFFVLLSVSGVRGALIKTMPRSLLLAITAGIGMFLTHLGLQQSDGLGIVTYQSATLVTLGGCPKKDRAHMYTIVSEADVCVPSANITAPIIPNLGPPSSNYTCLKGMLRSPTMWLGIAGLLIISFCTMLDVKGATMIGVLFVTFISWIPGHGASYFGADSEIDGGESRFAFFKQVVTLPHLGSSFMKFDFSGLTNVNFWMAVFTMLYVGFFDTTGTLYAMGNFIGQYLHGFINDKKEFERMNIAFTTDGVCTMIASLGGLSPICCSGESGAGIREGGRTGIAGIVTGCWFLASMFLAPLFASIPPYATGPALVVVGALMMSTAAEIDWDNPMKSIPAFITIVMMPLTYSIAYGVIAGLVVYVCLRLMRKGLALFCIYVLKKDLRLGYRKKPDDFGDEDGELTEGELQDMLDEEKEDLPAFASISDPTTNKMIKRAMSRDLELSKARLSSHVSMRGDPEEGEPLK